MFSPDNFILGRDDNFDLLSALIDDILLIVTIDFGILRDCFTEYINIELEDFDAEKVSKLQF